MFTPLVTLFIGLITAVIGAVTLIATKENKISEFRQAWIDSQRNDLSVALSAAVTYFDIQDSDKKAQCLSEFLSAKHRVSLREKPRGREWKAVLFALYALERNMLSGTKNVTTIQRATLIITVRSRVPLKSHWETVKSGESGYRWFKYILVVFLVLMVVSVGIISLTAVVASFHELKGDSVSTSSVGVTKRSTPQKSILAKAAPALPSSNKSSSEH